MTQEGRGTQTDLSVKLLRGLLITYILLSLVIAGLNYGYVPGASPEAAARITALWHIYENWVKTVFIIIGSVLTLAIVRRSRRIRQRTFNLIGFFIAALIVHITLPLVLDNPDLYFFGMPLPWSTIPLQAAAEGSEFYQRYESLLGAAGISWAVTFFIVVNIVVFIGTLILGRRWQCSTLCLFNGFAAEVFAPIMPLYRRDGRWQARKQVVHFFGYFRWFFLAAAFVFTGYWSLLLFGVPIWGASGSLASLELWKYLVFELLLMMFCWVALTGRGYCFICPLGTVLALMGKLVRQRVVTTETECISCGRCSRSCPMSIDVQSFATKGKPVDILRCVGCRHCVDACSTGTLRYTTGVLEVLRRTGK